MLSPEAGGGGRRPGTRGASRLSGRGGPLQHAAQTCSPLKAHMSSAAPSGPSCSPNCSCLPILLHYPRVLKCRFYYHSGAVSASGQVTADTQTVARLLPGGGATPSHTATATAPRGSTQLVRRLREKMWGSAFVVASQEGAGQARQAGLGMASLDNFRRLWSTGLSIPTCLALALGWLGQGDKWS